MRIQGNILSKAIITFPFPFDLLFSMWIIILIFFSYCWCLLLSSLKSFTILSFQSMVYISMMQDYGRIICREVHISHLISGLMVTAKRHKTSSFRRYQASRLLPSTIRSSSLLSLTSLSLVLWTGSWLTVDQQHLAF